MNFSNWYFPVSAIINLVVTLSLGIYIILNYYKNRVAKYIFYVCFSIAFWAFFYILWQFSSNARYALAWSRMFMFGAALIGISLLHLVMVFLELDKQQYYRVILFIFYGFTAIWICANFFSDLFVIGVAPASYFRFWPQPGPFYLPYLISFFIYMAYAGILVFRKYIKLEGNEKARAGLLLVTLIIGAVGGSTNYFLWYGINIAPWGNISVSIFVVTMVYTMMRFSLVDVEVALTELFTGLIIAAMFVDMMLSKNLTQLIVKSITFVSTVVIGWMLIRSVRKEVRRREEMATLANSLTVANIRLKELDKQKTDFLSIAAHQLRTPLSISSGYLELLEEDAYGKVPKQAKDIFHNMDESNGRLVSLVDSFLDITRLEQGRTKYDYARHDINALITNVVKELSERAEGKGLKLVWHSNKELPSAVYDEEKIRHVIFNFIDNAIKYSDEGKITTDVIETDGGLTVRVRDNGLGFEKKDQANFFQKFYRGDNVQGINVNGTGLGLYVCRMFIEAHHGKVWARSDGLKRGSEFGFWIPIRQA